MADNQNKTRPGDADVDAYIASVGHERRREEARVLLGLFDRVTGLRPRLWGESIVGYGRYDYKTAAGRQETYFLTGFAPRKAAMTVYIMPGFSSYGDRLARLGKHRHSRSCLYLARLAAVDLDILAGIVGDSVATMRNRYTTFER